MVRRAADPGDSNKGPINAIKPVLKVPSHHGPDVMTVKPEININSMAVAVPIPQLCPHVIVATLPEGHGLSTESVLEMWNSRPRITIMNGSETGITQQLQKLWNSQEILARCLGGFTRNFCLGRWGEVGRKHPGTTSKRFTKNLMLYLKM